MTSGYKRCANGHFYKDEFSSCPYCVHNSNDTKFDFYLLYCLEDHEIVKMIVENLIRKGYTVLFDDSIIGLEKLEPSRIKENIDQSRVIVSISLQNSSSSWFFEFEYAKAIGKRCISITRSDFSSEEEPIDTLIQKILDGILGNGHTITALNPDPCSVPFSSYRPTKTMIDETHGNSNTITNLNPNSCSMPSSSIRPTKTMFDGTHGNSNTITALNPNSCSMPSSSNRPTRTMIIDDEDMYYRSTSYWPHDTSIATYTPFNSSIRGGRRTIVGLLREINSQNITHQIYVGRNIIGRALDCQICVDDMAASSKHATLLYRNGSYLIQDSMSASGTYVNGEDIGYEAAPLNDCDIIRIGNTIFEFIEKDTAVYSSVFAPAEIQEKSHMLVQVYLHLFEETEEVKSLAQESQKDAERRDYVPLQCKLKKGDKVDIQLNIYGEALLMSEKKSVIWQGSLTKCSFDFFATKGIDAEELSCMVMLTVNSAIVGEMRFITKIVEQPRNLNPYVFAHQYHKIFISYAHQDTEKVVQMARAYQAQGVEYFFDRHYLKPGDIFPLKIQEFIDTADLFILCWSANAAKSEYVELERQRALRRAFPQVQPIEKAELSIYPMSIEPRAELPADMIGKYNFEMV